MIIYLIHRAVERIRWHDLYKVLWAVIVTYSPMISICWLLLEIKHGENKVLKLRRIINVNTETYILSKSTWLHSLLSVLVPLFISCRRNNNNHIIDILYALSWMTCFLFATFYDLYVTLLKYDICILAWLLSHSRKNNQWMNEWIYPLAILDFLMSEQRPKPLVGCLKVIRCCGLCILWVFVYLAKK